MVISSYERIALELWYIMDILVGVILLKFKFLDTDPYHSAQSKPDYGTFNMRKPMAAQPYSCQ
ncbi:MAG: hypothetical protein U9Q05_00230 [Thermodesulfobacteriota bacterium]|nr:hypothetical protein [Thermodesulfobacteriota bacterium]